MTPRPPAQRTPPRRRACSRTRSSPRARSSGRRPGPGCKSQAWTTVSTAAAQRRFPDRPFQGALAGHGAFDPDNNSGWSPWVLMAVSSSARAPPMSPRYTPTVGRGSTRRWQGRKSQLAIGCSALTESPRRPTAVQTGPAGQHDDPRRLTPCESRRRSSSEGPGNHPDEHRGRHGRRQAQGHHRRAVRGGQRRPTCGTTRTTRRRSPASCPTRRPSSGTSRNSGSGWTTSACCSNSATRTRTPWSRRRRSSSRLQKEIDAQEVRTLLSGEYDEREALVTIRSEAGGVDAADFAEMLMRMYLRWSERHGYPTEVYDTSYAEEAGIKSPPSRSRRPTPTAPSPSSRAPTGWSGSPRSTTRAAGRPRSPASRWRRSWRPATTSRSTRRSSGSTSTARPDPAARASTPPTRRSGSPTSRPASWCPARTSARRSRTGRRR